MQRLVICLAVVLATALLPRIAGATPADKVVAEIHGAGTHEDGTVRITQGGDGALVVFVLLTGAAGTVQPAEIDRGTCSAPGTKLKQLVALTGGRSMSVLPGINYNIVRQGSYVAIVRASPFDARMVSCGAIGRGARMTNQSETDGYGGRTTP